MSLESILAACAAKAYKTDPAGVASGVVEGIAFRASIPEGTLEMSVNLPEANLAKLQSKLSGRYPDNTVAYRNFGIVVMLPEMESLSGEDFLIFLGTAAKEAGKLIVTDGGFSMGGDLCKLPQIVALAKAYGARTMIDDAHGLGVLGPGGRGTAAYFDLVDQVDIITGTFSKSLASLGGFMAGDARVVDYVRHVSRPFIFCASIPPASCATALEALRILKENPQMPQRLLELSAYMRRGLTQRGIPIRESATPIIPIYTYEATRTLQMAKRLYEAGVYVNPVLPPATPATECLLRTSYMATLTEALLDEALDIFERVLKGHGEA